MKWKSNQHRERRRRQQPRRKPAEAVAVNRRLLNMRFNVWWSTASAETSASGPIEKLDSGPYSKISVRSKVAQRKPEIR